MPPRRPPEALLPLKPFVLQLLVALSTGDLHGWGLLKAIEARTGGPVLPGQLYRQIETLLANGLIEERDRPGGGVSRETREEHVGGAPARRFFRLTPFGRRVVEAEAGRLERLVAELRTAGLHPSGKRS